MSLLLAAGFDGITDVIFGVIGGLLYPLFSVVFALIEMVEGVFKALAGIGDVSVNGKIITSNNTGGDFDSGLIYYMLNNQTIQDMFFSILMLALVLIIIFTVMAFIKNAYASKPKNWQEIIGSSIKGLANFIFLPVCCLLGVLLGNILLQAINGATSKGGAATMDRKLFIACAYNANLVRTSDDAGGITWGQLDALTQNKMIIDNNKTFADYYDISFSGKNANDKIINSQTSKEDKIYYANLIDQIFAETTVNLHTWGINAAYLGVGSFYSLWQINYLVLIVGGIFMLYVLLALAFAMVKRMFYILILFVISPAICSMYPLDDGNAVKSWSGEFKKQVLSAYGAVAGMNIFFSMIPLIDQIEIWGKGWGFNDIFQIFMLVSGLLVVKDLIGLISGFVGGDNAYATGSGLMNSTRSAMKKYGGGAVTKTTGAFARAAGAASQAKGFFGKTGAFLGRAGKDLFIGASKAANETILSGMIPKDIKSDAEKAYYQGASKYKGDSDIRSKGKYGEIDAKNKTAEYSAGKLAVQKQASATYNLLGDEMKSVAYNTSIKTNVDLDLKGKKQDQAEAEMKMLDTVSTLSRDVALTAAKAGESLEAAQDYRKSLTNDEDKKKFDEAVASGKMFKAGDLGLEGADLAKINKYILDSSKAREAQTAFENYAEANKDTIQNNTVASSLVQNLTDVIDVQKASDSYTAIGEGLVEEINKMQRNIAKLSDEITDTMQDTKNSKRQATRSKGMSDAKKS